MGTHVLLDGQCVLTKIPREEDGRPVLMLRSGYPHHVGAGYFDDPPVERRLSENVIASPFLPRAAEGGEEEVLTLLFFLQFSILTVYYSIRFWDKYHMIPFISRIVKNQKTACSCCGARIARETGRG